jgi:hypothetical protein
MAGGVVDDRGAVFSPSFLKESGGERYPPTGPAEYNRKVRLCGI